MQIKITNIIAVSELEWYNSKVEELKKLPLKTQWTIRKNMKVLEPISQEFMTFRQELEEKKTSEWFVEGNGKCEKKTDDEGNEMLQILDEYMDEFLKYNNDLNKQINEIAFEEVEVEVEVGEDEEYNSEQSYAIHLRNSRLIEMGWDVIRFMPYQIKDDLEWCVKILQSKITI